MIWLLWNCFFFKFVSWFFCFKEANKSYCYRMFVTLDILSDRIFAMPDILSGAWKKKKCFKPCICRFFLNRFPVCFNHFVLLFLVIPYLIVAVQPCIEWILFLLKKDWIVAYEVIASGSMWGCILQLHACFQMYGYLKPLWHLFWYFSFLFLVFTDLIVGLLVGLDFVVFVCGSYSVHPLHTCMKKGGRLWKSCKNGKLP